MFGFRLLTKLDRSEATRGSRHRWVQLRQPRLLAHRRCWSLPFSPGALVPVLPPLGRHWGVSPRGVPRLPHGQMVDDGMVEELREYFATTAASEHARLGKAMASDRKWGCGGVSGRWGYSGVSRRTGGGRCGGWLNHSIRGGKRRGRGGKWERRKANTSFRVQVNNNVTEVAWNDTKKLGGIQESNFFEWQIWDRSNFWWHTRNFPFIVRL